MDKLYGYMKKKLKDMQENKRGKVVIGRDEFMQLMKMICYMRQIRRIAEDM